MKADTICCYCKRMTKGESLHATRLRLTGCESWVRWVYLQENSRKICPAPSLRSYLCSSSMGIFLRDYGTFLEGCALLEIQAR